MTPFDIRIEVLKMAKDFLEAQFYQNQNNFQLLIDAAVKVNGSASDILNLMPKFPTSQEILEQADKFYTFVGVKK